MSSLLNLPEISCPDSCDICEDEKPRWYCAADEAYLCDGCDLSVHGMNSLAMMHQRMVLGCGGGYNELPQKVPCSADDASNYVKIKHESSCMYDSYNNMKSGSVQKLKKDHLTDELQAMNSSTQASGFVKIGSITYTRATKVKLETDSQFLEEHKPYEFDAGYNKRKAASENCVHEVPVLVPVAQEIHSINLHENAAKQTCSSFLGASSEDSSTYNFMEYLVPDFCDVDNYIISNVDPFGNEEESDVKAELQAATDVNDCVEEKVYSETQGNTSTLEPSFSSKSPQSILQEYDRYYERNMNDLHLEYLELNMLKHSEKPKATGIQTFVPLAWVCEKLKVESNGETDQINKHLEALIERPFHSITREVCNQQSFLSLNYEDVLSAWSDRGCFWTDGQKPTTLSLDSTSSSLEEADVGIVPEIQLDTIRHPDQQKETASSYATTEDGGREARVLRYREKRRTRLFSKKIRYEVRKLNAEKRPRVKGRFVKRSS